MTKRDQLIEAYEDALFSLLMDEVMQMEGEQAIAWNEELKSDPKYAVPENITSNCEKIIKDEFKKIERKSMKKTAYKVFQRISVAVMIIMVLFTTAFALSEPVRIMTLNALLTINTRYSEFNFIESDDDPVKVIPDETVEYHYNIGLEWVPSGYQVVDGVVFPNGDGKVEYEDDSGNTIKLRIIRFDSTPSYKLDSENAKIDEVTIKGQQAYLITKEIGTGDDTYIERSLLCINDEQQIIIDILSTGLTEDELLHLAEGVHWKDD